ncbi:MAG: CD225/dispanin family protein [Actinomycetota bacterium]|nr:CD225/dispanin family protein [Actinomycetota bacterium]
MGPAWAGRVGRPMRSSVRPGHRGGDRRVGRRAPSPSSRRGTIVLFRRFARRRHMGEAGPPPTRRGTAMANRPSPPHPSTRRSAPPPSHLTWAVLTTVCFLPLGVLALRHATQVERLWYAGRDDDARRSSRSARDLALAAVVGAVLVVLVTVSVTAAGTPFA